MPTAKMFVKVSVKLLDAQVLKLGEQEADEQLELDKARLDLDAFIEEHKAAKKLKEEAIERREKKVTEIATQIDKREAEVDIEAREVFDDHRQMVMLVRADNEREVLREWRPMTTVEIAEAKKRTQGKLPLVDDEGAKASVSDLAAHKAKGKGKKPAGADEAG